jgi:acetolactate synthase-1/2/3 large subunit
MNGARALIESLVNAGVEVCFANPGTSEMHLVEAIDQVEGLRPVLCLFEGVCTGAADGYARMRGAPAMTLLHLGAGLGNGIANLHNARRAATPVVNVVGDHAIHHVPYDAPLTADIEAVARPVSAWIRTARTSDGLGGDGWDAVAAALAPRPDPAGRVATLIVPADCAWGDARPASSLALPERYQPFSAAAVEALSGQLDEHAMLLLDGNALGEKGLAAAARVAAASGCRVYSTTFPARVEAGPELFPVSRLPYFPEQILELLSALRTLVLVGSDAPVSFFAYRGQPSSLVPQNCVVRRLNHRHQDGAGALSALADAIDAGAAPTFAKDAPATVRPELPTGELSNRAVGQVLAALAPDGSVVTSDSGGGGAAFAPMQRSVRHTWLHLTGGAIGQAGPVAVGAAVACPERPVFALIGDGAAMYTNQFLWTTAREQLKVITVIYSNRSYGILDVEYRRLGINQVGARAASLFDLSGPDLDWTAMAQAQGVPGVRARTCGEFAAAVQTALDTPGPHLIEAQV